MDSEIQKQIVANHNVLVDLTNKLDRLENKVFNLELRGSD